MREFREKCCKIQHFHWPGRKTKNITKMRKIQKMIRTLLFQDILDEVMIWNYDFYWLTFRILILSNINVNVSRISSSECYSLSRVIMWNCAIIKMYIFVCLQMSWQAQHFHWVGCRFCGRRSTFARPINRQTICIHIDAQMQR